MPLRSDDPLSDVDDDTFVRLTRRALGHYGDLTKLVASPLTALPVIDERLAARGAPDHPVERANELKAVLADGIGRLKPRDGGDFGTTEQWRYYNSLYFPYVVGVRAYAQNATAAGLDPTARQAWQWLVTEVPQRSLHNWQNAAARLIAADLRGRVAGSQRLAKRPCAFAAGLKEWADGTDDVVENPARPSCAGLSNSPDTASVSCTDA